MLMKAARLIAVLGTAAAIATAVAAPSGAGVTTATGTGYAQAALAPADHNLLWIAWDDTIYRNYSTCMSRGSYLAQVYTDIVAYRCVNRWTVNVRPTRYGMMLEVQRP